MIIIVTGSPGTGKTTLVKKLADKLGYTYVNVNKLIEENNLSDGYDKDRKCEIIDTERLNQVLIGLINKHSKLIIDSHLSHYLPSEIVDLCIVTKCELSVLKKRLEKRNYDERKVRENLDVEIFDNCLTEAQERGHKIKIIDTTKDYDINKIIEEIK